MFTIIEDGYVVLVKRGLYKQAKVYSRNGYIFAGYSGGFIRLSKNEGATSVPDLKYEDLVLPFTPKADSIGRLQLP